MSEQIEDLILMLVKKLTTVASLKADRQYSCQVRSADSETEDLIQVLSLQATTQSKTRLAANNLKSYRKANGLNSREIIDLNEKIMFSDILTSFETESSDFFIESTLNIDVRKKKSSILSLIKDTQEFNLLCR